MHSVLPLPRPLPLPATSTPTATSTAAPASASATAATATLLSVPSLFFLWPGAGLVCLWLALCASLHLHLRLWLWYACQTAANYRLPAMKMALEVASVVPFCPLPKTRTYTHTHIRVRGTRKREILVPLCGFIGTVCHIPCAWAMNYESPWVAVNPRWLPHMLSEYIQATLENTKRMQLNNFWQAKWAPKDYWWNWDGSEDMIGLPKSWLWEVTDYRSFFCWRFKGQRQSIMCKRGSVTMKNFSIKSFSTLKNII